MAFCRYCGKELAAGMSFCPACGKPLATVPATGASQTSGVQVAAVQSVQTPNAPNTQSAQPPAAQPNWQTPAAQSWQTPNTPSAQLPAAQSTQAPSVPAPPYAQTPNASNAPDFDTLMETLENEIGIPSICGTYLLIAYEKLSGVKLFQNEDEPSYADFLAFRTYLINNYKKMREEMGFKILMAESNGVGFNFPNGVSFNSFFGETVYKKIKEWAIANGAQKQGGCYVATAIYGSYDCPQVWTLRRYRDIALSRTFCGKAFIKVYYAVSPLLVKWFAGFSWFDALIRPLLNKFVDKLNLLGYRDTPYYD